MITHDDYTISTSGGFTAFCGVTWETALEEAQRMASSTITQPRHPGRRWTVAEDGTWEYAR